jgi:hypothetical protein
MKSNHKIPYNTFFVYTSLDAVLLESAIPPESASLVSSINISIASPYQTGGLRVPYEMILREAWVITLSQCVNSRDLCKSSTSGVGNDVT